MKEKKNQSQNFPKKKIRQKKKKNTHTSTRVTLDGQITMYLYIVS